MSIEQRLRQAYDRAAASEPDEVGAYDRFLRRRARQNRVVAVRTSIVLVVALTLALLVPRVLADHQPVADRPLPKELVSVPDQGFQLTIPEGWRVRELDGPMGLLLVPARPSTAGQPATIRLDTGALDPRIYPGRPPGVSAALADMEKRIMVGHPVAGGPFTTGRREDGRWFARADHSDLGGPWGQRYWLVWPYKCAKGTPCPSAALYRGLLVEATSPLGDRAATQATLWRIVQTVRPIGNAVDRPEPVAGRRPCRIPAPPGYPSDADAADVGLQTPDFQPREAPEAVGLAVQFLQGHSVRSCRLRQRVTLELWEGGRLANVRGNGSTVELDSVMPESAAPQGAKPSGWIFIANWAWRNWCGDGSVTVRYVGLKGWQHRPFRPPRCLDPTKPSTLELASVFR
jgi:hypothetical protein